MTKYTAFRCPVDLLAKAQIKAKADRRSLSNYIVTLIEENTVDVVLSIEMAKTPKAKAKQVKAKKPAKR